MKPVLKAPGSKRLKPKYDNLLSNFAFKFNLRHYIEGYADIMVTCGSGDYTFAGAPESSAPTPMPSPPAVVTATFKLALTAYTTAIEATLKATLAAAIGITGITAGWCRLKPVLKAPGYVYSA